MALRGAPIAYQVAVDDPGQLGAGNLPAAHRGRGPADPGEQAASQLPDVDPFPVSRRSYRLRPTRYVDPIVLTDMPERGEGRGEPIWTGYMPAGAPINASVPEIHGPDPRQPQPRRRGWWPWRRRPTAPDVMPAMGATLPGELEQGVFRPSEAALGRGNAFVVVDPRRVFSADRRADGSFSKPAGSALTGAPYDPSSWHHVNDPHVPNVVDGQLPPERTRAGAARPGEGRPPIGRPSVVWFTRPFDQWAAQEFKGHRTVFPSPLATPPLRTTREVVPGRALGFRSYFPAPGMEPVPVGRPNTFRTTPQPWDQGLVVSGGGGPVRARIPRL